MLWVYLVLTATVIWSIVNLIDKVAVSTYVRSPITYLIFIGLISIIPVVFLPTVWTISPIPWQYLLLSILTGVIYIGYTYLFFSSLQITDAPVVANLLLLVPVGTTIAGVFLFQESITIVNGVGILLVLIGTMCCSIDFDKRRKSGIHLSKPFQLMVASACLTTIDYSLQKFILKTVEKQTMFFWAQVGEFATVVLLLVLIKQYRKNFKNALIKIPALIVTLSAANEVLSLTAAFLLIYAYSIATLSLTTVILSSQPAFVLTLILTINFLTRRKVIPDNTSRSNVAYRLGGIALAFLGVVLITK